MGMIFSNQHRDYFVYDKLNSCNKWSFIKKQKSNVMVYTITALAIILIAISLSGCSEADINEEQEQCTQQNKKYIVEKQFNYRTGSMDKFVKCK